MIFFENNFLLDKSTLLNLFLETYNSEEKIIVPIETGRIDLERINLQFPNKEITVFQYLPLDRANSELTENIQTLKTVNEVLCIDNETNEWLIESGINSKVVPIIYNAKVEKISNVIDPEIDVLYYGKVTPRIFKVLKLLSDSGVNVLFVNENYTDQLDKHIASSKIVLNLHETEFTGQNFLKIAYLLANNKCIISEKSKLNYFSSLIIEENYDNIVSQVKNVLESNAWKSFSNINKKFLELFQDNRYTGYTIENKKMNNKKTKIVMMSMFKNEAHTIGRMLESCYKYIDYWILQNNGSTDGTPEVVENFFKNKNIPGFIYEVEEGWVGFGWNRDHVLQKVRQTDHGCDWILKMDCDETLVVDDNFDWSIFDDTSVQSWHIPALSGGTYYYRAWMWNAKLPWRFNHDTAHETICLDMDGIGEGFQRVNLPLSFKHVTYSDGQSYGVRTKYISDALKLEEKLIREDTMLTDHYHFWYVGKSYFDCYHGDFYPLKERHSEEFARRCIFYFTEFLDVTHNFKTTQVADRIDEMAYYAVMLIGITYQFLKDYDKAIDHYNRAENFAPVRNEHITRQAELYNMLGKYDKMFECTSRLVQPERTSPFPLYHFMIEASSYHDTSNYVFELHELAKAQLGLVENNTQSVPPDNAGRIEAPQLNLGINSNMKKRLFIVDNFYSNPDDIRQFALNTEFESDIRWYKGLRSKAPFRPPGLKEAFESIIGEKITVWEEHSYNGCFQITNAQDPQVYHHDVQRWAGMIYLTPNAPLESGTRLHRSKISGARHADEPEIATAFNGGFYDSTKFDIVDNAGNIYNRLVLMDARCIHSAGPYFGDSNTTGRLIHLFFFD